MCSSEWNRRACVLLANCGWTKKKTKPKFKLGRFLWKARVTTVAIWRENMLGYLSANFIWSEKRTDNCELRGTENVQGQISEHIFAPNGGYCIILQIFLATCVIFKIGEYWSLTNRALRPYWGSWQYGPSIRTKTTEGQYSPVRLEQARLVSSLLYGTRLMLYSFLSKEVTLT